MHFKPAATKYFNSQSLKDIFSEFSSFLESILIHNLASYLFLPDFRTGVNALIRPCLIFSAVMLSGISISIIAMLASY